MYIHNLTILDYPIYKYHLEKWDKLASFIPTRTKQQIRSH
jgi:hypothetical protein